MRDLPKADRRLRRKERQRMADDRQPLSARRAYRVGQEGLVDGFDLWKMADHKARFALMLLAPLIAILLFLLFQLETFLLGLPRWERTWIVLGLFSYGALATVVALRAIGALQPERAVPVIGESARGRRHAPLGIRHYEDILGWEVEDYQRAWRRVRREQLADEVAEQAHAVAKVNRRKYRTLHYFFRSLRWMTALALLLMAAIAIGLVLEGNSDLIQIGHDAARAASGS